MHLRENLGFLSGLLDHFERLRENYGMESRSMLEAGGTAAPREP
jgi:hypothetical protein